MDKFFALVIIVLLLTACSKVDISKKTAEVKIVQIKESINDSRQQAISKSNQSVITYTKEAVSKITNSIKIDEKYETPGVVEDRVDQEIEVVGFGDVI